MIAQLKHIDALKTTEQTLTILTIYYWEKVSVNCLFKKVKLNFPRFLFNDISKIARIFGVAPSHFLSYKTTAGI